MKNFNWGPGLFLIIYHILLAIALPFYFYFYSPSLILIAITTLLYFTTGISITAGYHRLYSHKAYKTTPLVEAVILFLATAAGQGSVLRWAFDHRLHHAHVDTDMDPYSIKKGFWYAHMFWLFEKPRPIDPKTVSDLLNNRQIIFQDKHYKILFVAANILIFAAVGLLLNDFAGAFILAWWFRLFALHHSTWFINSLAHTWGDKPFCKEQSAVNNYILSLLTFGEGYHNYHHTFSNDYRNRNRWYHFDPTKWFIWTLQKCGLASGLRVVNERTINKRMVMESRRLLSDKLKDLWYIKKDEVESKIQELSDQMIQKIGRFEQLKERYRKFRSDCSERAQLTQLKLELKKLQQSIRADWKHWKYLSKNILKLRPLET